MECEKKQITNYLAETNLVNCEVVCIHVKISNIQEDITSMINEFSSTSWISKLDRFSQTTFSSTSERTIEDISNKVKGMDDSALTADVGEYLVSYSAQNALVEVCGHTRLPIAELLKEKVSGNPGFDFHTISINNILVFGESKYSKADTPKTIAINQILDFIEKGKDHAEGNTLRPLLNETIIDNVANKIKAYAAAFSFNMDSIDLAFKNALKLDSSKKIIQNQKEFYLIAIEIC